MDIVNPAGGRGQINQVDECLQRIVDLVRDGMRQLAGSREFFGGANGIFRELAVGDVGQYEDLADAQRRQTLPGRRWRESSCHYQKIRAVAFIAFVAKRRIGSQQIAQHVRSVLPATQLTALPQSCDEGGVKRAQIPLRINQSQAFREGVEGRLPLHRRLTRQGFGRRSRSRERTVAIRTTLSMG